MSIDVTSEIEIQQLVAEVARFVEDPANDRLWIGGISGVSRQPSGPVGPGTRIVRVARFLRKRIEYEYEVVEYTPERVLAMRSVTGPFPMATRSEFDETSNGTRVRVRNQGGSGVIFALLRPLMARMVQRRVLQDLVSLKRILESGAAAGSDTPGP